MSNVKCQMSKGGENSQISYAEKSSLILDLILWLFDFCHDSAITKQALMALTAPKIENLGTF